MWMQYRALKILSGASDHWRILSQTCGEQKAWQALALTPLLVPKATVRSAGWNHGQEKGWIAIRDTIIATLVPRRTPSDPSND